MKKMLAVLKREYIQAVRKKSFIIITLAMPVLMSALMIVPSLIASRGMGEKNIVIVDGTGKLEEAIVGEAPEADDENKSTSSDLEKMAKSAEKNRPTTNLSTTYVSAAGQDPREVAQSYLDKMTTKAEEGETQIDGVLIIPADVYDESAAVMTYFSRSSTDLIVQQRLGRRINDRIQRERLTSKGIEADQIDSLLRRVDVEAIQLTKSGEEKKGGELNFLVGFLFAALLLIPSLIYGVEVMRGVVQEKTDRVVEVLISSLTPMQLLSGKILGLALVGMTQLVVWLSMGAFVGLYTGGMAAAMSEDINITQFLRPEIAFYFILFFALAYLLYVCFYAIAGAVCNSEKEANQFIAPVMMVLMIPWFLMMPIILNPESTLSVVLSLFPLFAPITMFVRILVSEPPFWHIALSVVLSSATIWGLFWMTAKIFRVGILSYGKRPTIPELWRWLKVA